ncbi:hypothetical protein [Myxococcus sp. AB036A]|uniref:hypothetical protein n=1 Tax=Myxococcus sp. AB036A TaxID=2562793 RepID=UPI001E46275F|nr:hypothetical protein [Myxococcus sp. AB036A]
MQTLSRPIARTLVVLSLLVSWPAFAEVEEARDPGFPRWLAISARGGYLMPGGRMDGAAEPLYLYEIYKGLFAAIVEPTIRIASRVEVGPWAQFSHAQMRIRCSAERTCKGSNLRFGLQGNYHWNPSGPIDLWSGVALGYDTSSFSVPAAEVTYSGPDVTLQAGFDRNFGGNFWAGLFVTGTGGQYDKLDVRLLNGSGSETLRERAFHLWIGFGFRVRVAAPHPAVAN